MFIRDIWQWLINYTLGSKFKTNDVFSLVNVSLKFETLITQIRQYFLLKKCVKLYKLLSFFQQKISVYLVIKS